MINLRLLIIFYTIGLFIIAMLYNGMESIADIQTFLLYAGLTFYLVNIIYKPSSSIRFMHDLPNGAQAQVTESFLKFFLMSLNLK